MLERVEDNVYLTVPMSTSSCFGCEYVKLLVSYQRIWIKQQLCEYSGCGFAWTHLEWYAIRLFALLLDDRLQTGSIAFGESRVYSLSRFDGKSAVEIVTEPGY